MSATTQLVIVGLVVAGAGLYAARAAWRAWFGRPGGKGCGAGCGTCAAAPPETPRDGRYTLPQV